MTSISNPTDALRSLAAGANRQNIVFLLIGDVTSPKGFDLDGCRYISIEEQHSLPFRFPRLCPEKSYARKNVGYLMAASGGAQVIIETDDDNFPLADFWLPRVRRQRAREITGKGWVNCYGFFTEQRIWPRGLPLTEIASYSDYTALPAEQDFDCLIQQGLADGNPDVDAIFRLTRALPVNFEPGRRVVLRSGIWCPFNSQNTTWWRDAFPLLYLPATCSFRMTDIWRSFIAQRIAHCNRWSILFHSPTVRQERNEHDLMKDFAFEIEGYLHNAKVRGLLEELDLREGVEAIDYNLLRCYGALVKAGLLGSEEIDLLQCWLADLRDANGGSAGR